MEPQLYGHHHYEEDPHDNTGLQYSVIGEEGEGHHGEKKSVLKKVKKIKETIKKNGHGDGNEHDYRHDQISEEEDEDMVNAPDVHGAPMYESPVIPGTNLPVQLEKPTDTPNVRNPNLGDGGVIRPSAPGEMGIELEKSSVGGRRPDFENLISPDATLVEEANVAEPTVQISPLMGLEEDPHSPKTHPGKTTPSNYQTKVSDPTGEGGKEAEVAPLLQRLDNFHIHEQSNPVPERRPFAPRSTPTVDQFTPESDPLSKNPVSPESLDQTKPESTPRDTIAGKISSATSAIADKAVSAKLMVASKLGYGGQPQPQDGDVSFNKKPVTELATEYGHQVAGAGSPVMSKVQGGGEAEGGDTAAKGTDGGVSVKEYLAEKLRPGEEDKALSEAITERFNYKRKEGMRGKEEEVQPVLEPEEVAARFGTAKEKTVSESSGAGVVDRLKGAVGSWLGKSTGTRSAHHSLRQSHVSGAGSVPSEGVGQSK